MMKTPWMVAALAALVGATAVAQPTLPRRQSGLWVASVDGRSTGMGQCVDQGSDDALTPMLASEPGKAECSRSAPRREVGDRVVVESVCVTPGQTKTVRVVFSGDFEREVSAELTTTYDPPRKGRAPRSHRMDMRWTGPCPAGVKPGQMLMAPVR